MDGHRAIPEAINVRALLWMLVAGLACLSSTIALAQGDAMSDASSRTPDRGDFTLSDCRLESANTNGSVAARCGRFNVPENPAAPTGRRIALHVAVIPALRSRDRADPLFVISGGPGQAASDFYLAMAQVFGRIRRDHDIVLIDQRGTGRSNKLDCPLPNDSDLTEADPAQVVPEREGSGAGHHRVSRGEGVPGRERQPSPRTWKPIPRTPSRSCGRPRPT